MQRECRTLEQVEKFFGVTRNAIRKWKLRGCPFTKTGDKYDTDKIQRWINENLPLSPRNQVTRGDPNKVGGDALNTPEGDDEPLTQRKLRAEIRKLEAQADTEEDKRDKIRGQLITIAEARREFVRMATTIKQNVLALPRSNADRLTHIETPAEAEAILTEILTEALEALSKSGGKFADSMDAGASPSGEADAEPVGGTSSDPV